MVAYATISVMEVTTRNAAAELGVSQRQLQRLARNGSVISRDVAGRRVVAGRSLLAASRSAGRGRRWDNRTVAAAAELLHNGRTEQISGSQRSRLRARLRTMALSEMAYHVLHNRVTLWRSTQATPATRDQLADGLTSTGARLEITVTADSATLARRARLLDDPEGETLLVQLDTAAASVIEDLALYAYGDERTSNTAAARIQALQVGLS
jgi:type II secretory pathway component PulJ